ncbi:MAG: hypothetical protein ACYTG0_02305 [Planctomycetota bacterium]|jgi:uncharacterized protein YwgA
MNTEDYRWLAALIAAHPDRQVVGRTRLQKTVRLLQRLGFPTRYRYSLYFYGPYSEDLQAEVDLLEVLELVGEKLHFSQEGTPYYIIRVSEDASLPDVKRYQVFIDRLAKEEPVVLELAATYDAFRELGCDHDQALERLRRKKQQKCAEERDTQALELLSDLGLSTS